MRRCCAALALATVLSLAAAPALAEDQRVTALPNDTWDRPAVTINVGEQVTWTNGGGLHNVRFDDGSYEMPRDPDPTPWTVSRRFEQRGEFTYICEAHPTSMRGRVTVLAQGQPPPGDTTSPGITDLESTRSRFCNTRRRSCRRRGTRFRFQLSEDAAVRAVVRPVGRPRGRRGDRFQANGTAGANSIRYSGRGLKPGRYRLTLTATDANGNVSAPARIRFTVIRSR
jgi:plastocyanin